MIIVRIEEYDGKTVKEVGVMLLCEQGDRRKPTIDIAAKTVRAEDFPLLADKIIVTPALKQATLNEINKKLYKKWDLVTMALNKMGYGLC